MPFVKRDQAGKIIAIFNTPQAGAEEELPPSHSDVVAFLIEGERDEEARHFLSRTDVEMVRIVEDLVDLLIRKNIILLTDLPRVAQSKLISRKRLRAKVSSEASPLVDQDSIL